VHPPPDPSTGLPGSPQPVLPVPTSITVAVSTFPDGRLVCLALDTPVGRSHYFLPVANAEVLVEQLQGAIRQATTGLVVARRAPDVEGRDLPRGPRHNGRVTYPPGHSPLAP
jgi:hypothetical protein